MKGKWLILLVSLGACVFFLSASHGSAQTRGGGGNCQGGPNQNTALLAPLMWSTVDTLTPTLYWKYPSDSSCTPDSYIVHLKTGPSFSDDIGGTSTAQYWTAWQPLQPGQEYAWGIQPVSGSTIGTYSGDHYFFTGPSCGANDLVAPDIIAPANNAVVNGYPMLSWFNSSGCLPEGYEVKLAPAPDYNFLADDPNVQTIDTHTVDPNWMPGQPLTDCTRYYWRVSPVVGGQPSNSSKTYTFRVDISGTCPAETNGIVQGTIWQDQCAAPGQGTPVPNPLPLGCVLKNNAPFPNQTYDPGEPGIQGIILAIWKDHCPTPPSYNDVQNLGVAETNSDGTYNFYEIPPGTYCVRTYSNDNNSALQPGTWTYPEDAIGQVVAQKLVTVGSAQVVNNVDFGWWYQYGTAWGSPNASVYGTVWQDYCAYNPADPIPDVIPSGCSIWNGSGQNNHWMQANAVRDANEPGIAGLQVTIGPGACPSAGLATATTDSNGMYVFNDLPPGKYCIEIDGAHNSNNVNILGNGQWTVVPTGHENITSRAITLTQSTTLSQQDFAWWNYTSGQLHVPFLIPLPKLLLDINANCRQGPGTMYKAVTSGLAGQSFQILGKNQEDTWYLVQFAQGVKCWIAKSVGSASGDISQLHVYLAPPLPTPSSPPVCSAHKDKTSCEADSSCTWAFTTSGPGYCKAK